MKFDDIDLNNDKNAPKLDIDFGLGNSGASDKKSGGGFSFGGGWGGGWGSTGNSWGFGGIEEDSSKKSAPAEDNSWNFNSTKKDKEKKKNNGFDFDFDNLAGEEGDDLGLSKTKTKDDKAEEDPW